MADSKPDAKTTLSDKEVKAPNLIERAKEEIEAILHREKSPQTHTETHGLRDDINENTSLHDVRAPNVFERAKEELEAIAQAIHHKKESPTHVKRDKTPKAEAKHTEEICSPSGNNVKAPNLFVRAKEEIEAIVHHVNSPHHHHKETHGMSDDIDENTPISEIKGPSVVERAKEEFEAIVHAMHPKMENDNFISFPEKEGGFGSSIGRGLEKICSPWSKERDK